MEHVKFRSPSGPTCPGPTAVRPVPVAAAAPLNGTFDAFAQIQRAEGAAALWRGLSPTLVMAVPATVIYFVGYDELKELLGPGASTPLVAGPLARLIAVTIISPIEMVRTKMQARPELKSFGDVGSVVRSAVRTEGWTSLWRGLGPTLLRDVPFSAIYWSGFELIKSAALDRLGKPGHGGAGGDLADDDAPPAVLAPRVAFAAGAVAGAVAGALTLPFDVVKTQMQVELGMKLCEAAPPTPPPTTRAVMRKIWMSQGLAGLFVGLAPRVVSCGVPRSGRVPERTPSGALAGLFRPPARADGADGCSLTPGPPPPMHRQYYPSPTP